MNGGPSGFNNAQVTRAFVIASFVFSTFFGIRGASSHLGFSYQDIFTRLKIWKLVASVFTFSSTPELLFGLCLLYFFRVFERQIGSNKYSVSYLLGIILMLASVIRNTLANFVSGSSIILVALLALLRRSNKNYFGAFILFSIVVSSLLEVVASAVFNDSAVNELTPGPYGLIFASFVPFFFDIPVSTMFRVYGVRFSDKSVIYLAGFQLLLSSWKRSIVPGMCGLLAGSLYRLNFFGIRKAKFPDFISSFFSRLAWPPAASPIGASSRNAVGSTPSYAGRNLERTYPSPATPSLEPPEGSIATLEAMGFDRSSARQALVHAMNDINVATNILLEAQSH